MIKKTVGKHVKTVCIMDRIYKITASRTGLRIYRGWHDRPGYWHHEGDAPGVAATDYKEAIRRFVTGQSMAGLSKATVTRAQTQPYEVGYEAALAGIAVGQWSADEVGAVGVWSTSQLCVVALVLGRPGPEPYFSTGDSWRRLDTNQRAIVRRYAPLAADAADFAAQSSRVADHA